MKETIEKGTSATRSELQDYGNELRDKHGSDILARKAYEIISKSDNEKWVIDSIRNTHEIAFLRESIGTFYVIATWADQDVRWKRVETKYNRNRVAFETDDTRDSRENSETGQQVTLCYQMADIIILKRY